MAEIAWNRIPLSSIIIDEKRIQANIELFKKFKKELEEQKMANKFKVGDMVIGNDKADKRYAITRKGWIGQVKRVWDLEETISVKDVNSEKSYTVYPDCFDFYIPHEGKILIMVDEKDPNKIIARDLITKKTSEARRNPKDEWDFSKGAKLALERLYPEKKEEEKPKYWSWKVVCVKADLDQDVICAVYRKPLFTVGKVYEVKDGALYDNKPLIPYIANIESVDQLNLRVAPRYSFVEFKGEA